MAKLSFDGKEYNLNSLSDRAKKIAGEIKLLDANAEEKLQLIKVLRKSRETFTQELKNEIVSAKAGCDFSEQ